MDRSRLTVALSSFKAAYDLCISNEAGYSVVFYCEVSDHYFSMYSIAQVLKKNNVSVIWICSDVQDPALNSNEVQTRFIGSGLARDIFFRNVICDVFITSTPDLGCRRFPRSNGASKYIYVQHSLVSLIGAYESGAFLQYDYVFCATDQQFEECEFLSRYYNRTSLSPYAHGFEKVDRLRKVKKEFDLDAAVSRRRVLIAPTWGASSLIESGAIFKVMVSFLNQDCDLVLCPHSMTIVQCPENIDVLTHLYEGYRQVTIDTTGFSWKWYPSTDLLVTDWSGSALEFSVVFGRPIVFIETPPKIRNKDFNNYNKLTIESLAVGRLGPKLSPGDTVDLDEISAFPIDNKLLRHSVFNIDRSAVTGAEFIAKLVG